ncbi:chalcone isomerase family protein [Shewanella algicola]|uniref:chalcone isomerase family protein n=1 Tax=Shewanella algicola TaxID=640633 RepID=UPI00249578F3|nr:chalcone isomerase family protein [Shewanella algicola]
MKTLNRAVNVSSNAYQWLVELLFGVVGAAVVILILTLSMSNAMANQSSTTHSTEALPVLTIQQPSATLIQVGSASMSMMWFDIYSATLYSIDGKYQAEQWPLKLEIEYHRDIDAEDLIDATVDQWLHLGLSEQQIDQYREQLVNAWPDVKEGDRLTFMVNNRAQSEFLFNDKPYFQVSHIEFPQDFLAIWLSENTSRPKLRQQLIGMN